MQHVHVLSPSCRGGLAQLLQAVKLITFCIRGLVESPILGGNRSIRDRWARRVGLNSNVSRVEDHFTGRDDSGPFAVV